MKHELLSQLKSYKPEREKKNFISKMKTDIFIDLLKLNQRLDFTQG